MQSRYVAVENIVRKGEIACNKQFLLFSQNFLPYVVLIFHFNPFAHDNILDQTKLKAFADDKLNVTKMIISIFYRVENIVGKGEIACTSNFSFSLNVFKRLLA